MNPGEAPPAARETAERVKLLFQFSPEGLVTSAVVGTAVAFFLWNEVDRHLLVAWVAWVLLVCGGRYALYVVHQRRAPPVDEAPAWGRYFIFGSALMGLAWAALPAVLFPERSTEYQLVVTFIVAVMGMGAVGTLGPSLPAFAFFVAPMALAMVARLLLQGGPIFLGIGVVALFYVALLLRIWKEFHGALTATIRTRFENEALIAQLRRAEEALKAALFEEQRIMDTATVGIVFLKERKVLKCNRHFAVMFGYAQEELIGHSSAIWYPSVEAWQELGGKAYATVERGEPYEFEQEFVKKNGDRLWCHVAGRMLDATDPARGSIWVYSDVTERKRREEEVRELAHHDALTGLPNRRLLDDRLAQAFASARRSRGNAALMLLDLDRFKPINDNYGHEAGDAVLKVVGARLKGCVREADTVARIGGDEFVVMLLVHAPNDAVRVAEKILDSLARPIPVAGNEFQIGVSIGISVFPDDATEQEALLKFADRAMYLVKAAGRHGYRFYAQEQAPAQA